jgi:hypothetical protein
MGPQYGAMGPPRPQVTSEHVPPRARVVARDQIRGIEQDRADAQWQDVNDRRYVP